MLKEKSRKNSLPAVNLLRCAVIDVGKSICREEKGSAWQIYKACENIKYLKCMVILQLNFRKINDRIKKWAKDLTDVSPKKTYRWLTNTWKDAQHHSSSEKCKSKSQWGTITHQSEWLLSKSLQAINAGEDVDKKEPSYTVGGNAN